MFKKAEVGKEPAGGSSFYRTRRRMYSILVLFVLVAGMPMAAIPKLRDRLFARAWVIKEALAGNRAPVLVQVGRHQEPLPPEFQRPSSPSTFPQMPRSTKIYSDDEGGFVTKRKSTRVSAMAQSAGTGQGTTAWEGKTAEEALSLPAVDDNEPRYGQGAAERQAYELLLDANPAVAEIARGNSAHYKFKSWDAASRGEDLYWVRLKIQSEGQTEGDYIWQVRLESGLITPLNYNARSVH